MIKIRRNIKEDGHCYACKRINYESKVDPKPDMVDSLNEIEVSQKFPVPIYLCDKCMKELFDELAKIVLPQHGDLIDRGKLKFIEYINGDVTVSKEVVMNQPVIIQANIDKT